MELSPSNDVINSPTKYVEPRLVKDLEGTKLKSPKDIEELKSKMNTLDSKLIEASLFHARYLSSLVFLTCCLRKEFGGKNSPLESTDRKIAYTATPFGAMPPSLGEECGKSFPIHY